MGRRITIDPITRIEGHLRIDCEVDGGHVSKAWSSGQMWRGVELILLGRDPRDAWAITQRICGVCTTVHAIASVRAVENALKLDIPINAQYIRNLIILAHAVHDHIVHFYHLSALDWVDVRCSATNRPTSRPSASACSAWKSCTTWTAAWPTWKRRCCASCRVSRPRRPDPRRRQPAPSALAAGLVDPQLLVQRRLVGHEQERRLRRRCIGRDARLYSPARSRCRLRPVQSTGLRCWTWRRLRSRATPWPANARAGSGSGRGAASARRSPGCSRRGRRFPGWL